MIVFRAESPNYFSSRQRLGENQISSNIRPEGATYSLIWAFSPLCRVSYDNPRQWPWAELSCPFGALFRLQLYPSSFFQTLDGCKAGLRRVDYFIKRNHGNTTFNGLYQLFKLVFMALVQSCFLFRKALNPIGF